MTRNIGQDLIELQRQEVVARLHARRVSQREIVRTLPKLGIKNPDTGEPYSVATVNRDIAKVKRRSLKLAQQDMLKWRAEVLAELQEVARTAWRRKDLGAVLKALKQITDLLGLDEPIKIDIRQEVIEWGKEAGLSEAEAVREAEEYLRIVNRK